MPIYLGVEWEADVTSAYLDVLGVAVARECMRMAYDTIVARID